MFKRDGKKQGLSYSSKNMSSLKIPRLLGQHKVSKTQFLNPINKKNYLKYKIPILLKFQ
jgi:hypothetical protein